uniref:IQ motif containing C n=1 Tax=Salmo trutta TaxID=8032 RepID=A0A674A3S6_SALTR
IGHLIPFPQAHARGYLMRKEINCARSEFEDIVRDIDGEVNHLDWKGNIIAIPHFKDVSILRVKIKCYWMCTHILQMLSRTHKTQSYTWNEQNIQSIIQKKKKKKTKSIYSHGGKVITVWQLNTGMVDLMTCSECVCLFPGSQQWCSLAQDEPHTPEALQLHRNTLAMEMLWLQQAIASRKKYLSLKERLNIS